MAGLRNPGHCRACGTFVSAGSPVSWLQGSDGRNRWTCLRCVGGQPAPPSAAPSGAPPPAAASTAPPSAPPPASPLLRRSVSLEMAHQFEDGHVLVRLQESFEGTEASVETAADRMEKLARDRLARMVRSHDSKQAKL